MNAETDTKPQPPTRMSTLNLKDAKTIGQALQTVQFQRAVTDAAPSHMAPSRLMATFRQAARNKPEFEQCSLMSVLGVFMTCTFLGLEPNTPQGHAYMIPFAKKRWDKARREMVDDGYDLQLIIGYQGYLDLAYRSPRVSSVAAHAVYEGDDFSFEYGSNEHLQHRPKGLQADGDLPRYFYMFSKLTGGQAFEVLPYSKVIQIRNGSQGYRAAVAAQEKAIEKGWKVPAAYTEAPWVKHFTAMGQKTAMRAGYKWLPKTIEMAATERLEDQQDRGLIDFGPVLEGSVNPLEEDLPMITEPRADPGAAFSERAHDEDGVVVDPEPVKPPVQAHPAPRQAPAQRPAPTAAATAPAQAQPAQAAPTAAAAAPPVQGFAAHLAAADGEIYDAVGDAGYVTDPLVFARAYADLWRGASPDSRQALAEHNADGLEDACAASAEALHLLASLKEEQPPAAPPPPPAPTGPVAIAVQVIDGKPDLRGYLAALRTAAEAQTAATWDEWSRLQRPIITALSQVTRRNAEKICADRATALGADRPPPAPQPPADPPPATAAPAPTAAEPPTDPHEPPPPTGNDQPGDSPDDGGAIFGNPIPPTPWSRPAQDLIDQLDGCTQPHELEALAANAAVKVAIRNITAADEDEGKRLVAYAVARRAAVTAAARQ